MTYMKKKDPNQFTTPHGSVNYPILLMTTRRSKEYARLMQSTE